MADLYSRVQVSAAAGEAPADVIFITEEGPSNVVATGNMLPLNDLIEMSMLDTDDFEKLDFWTVDGDVMAIPTYLQLVMMDYNAARLAEAGIESLPTTWAEFHDQAHAIQASGVDDHPIAFGAISWSWWLMALSMGDPMFDEDLNPVFADEGSKAREAMALLKMFFDHELISPGDSGRQHQPARAVLERRRHLPSSLAGLAGGGEQPGTLAAGAGQQIPGAARSRQYLELPRRHRHLGR